MAAFLVTTDDFLIGDFLAGEAMAGLVDLLGVRGVEAGLLFLATVSTFPPLFTLFFAKELLFLLSPSLLGVITAFVTKGLINLFGNLAGDLDCNLIGVFRGEF